MHPFGQARATLLLTLLMAGPALAGAVSSSGKSPLKTKVVKRADGSVMERLALKGTAGKRLADAPMRYRDVPPAPGNKATDATADARVMTALGAISNVPREGVRNLPIWLDPASVRNWAEFVDPALALRAQLQAQSQAERAFITDSLWRYTDARSRTSASESAGHALAEPVHQAESTDTRPHTTWRSVVMDGAARSLNGQQALEAWMKLPMPDPKANPWLVHLGTYRY